MRYIEIVPKVIDNNSNKGYYQSVISDVRYIWYNRRRYSLCVRYTVIAEYQERHRV